VESNADQLRYLCAELKRDYGVEARSVEPESLSAPDMRAEIERSDLLVTSSFHSDEVHRVARRAGQAWIVVALREDFVGEVTRHLALGPVHFVVADARYAERLRAICGHVRGAANLRALVVGRDDIERIPAGTPVYVTRAARERLGDAAILARGVPLDRMLSRTTARAILSFVVDANLAALRSRSGTREDEGSERAAVRLAREPAEGRDHRDVLLPDHRRARVAVLLAQQGAHLCSLRVVRPVEAPRLLAHREAVAMFEDLVREVDELGVMVEHPA
jgi:hypothetical protein